MNPLLTLSSTDLKPSTDLESALRHLNLPCGHTVDAESCVYNQNGTFVGIIIPAKWESGDIPSPVPKLYAGNDWEKYRRWHNRFCLVCPIRQTECE